MLLCLKENGECCFADREFNKVMVSKLVRRLKKIKNKKGNQDSYFLDSDKICSSFDVAEYVDSLYFGCT